MSKIQPLFTWRSAFQSPGGPESPVTRHVLLSISLYMSEKGEGAFPSMEKLSEDTGLNLRTIKKHVPLAEELGWIKVVKKAGRGRGWKRNDYKAQIPESYYKKMKEFEAEVVNEIHQQGGEPYTPPQNNVVNLSTGRGESECIDVVNEVHLITPVNSSSNSPETRARKISFDFFWEEYEKPIDEKTCRDLWSSLSEEDKKRAIGFIPSYKKYQPEHRYRKNPETFLSSRFWENDFITQSANKPRPNGHHPTEEFYTQPEAFAWLAKKRIDVSQMENYFELTDQRKGRMALWKPKI